MTEREAAPVQAPAQMDALVSPGALLKAAREAQGIDSREADERLKLMPGYVAILERDDYQALRSPPFARGYVRSYGKLLGLNEDELLGAFDRLRAARESQAQRPDKRVQTRPLQLQRTGLGVIIGLAILLLLVLVLWWWQGDTGRVPHAQVKQPPGQSAPSNTAGEQ